MKKLQSVSTLVARIPSVMFIVSGIMLAFVLLMFLLPSMSYSQARQDLMEIGTFSTIDVHDGVHIIYISPNLELTEKEEECVKVLRRKYTLHTGITDHERDLELLKHVIANGECYIE